jgi:hypothetical protein
VIAKVPVATIPAAVTGAACANLAWAGGNVEIIFAASFTAVLGLIFTIALSVE